MKSLLYNLFLNQIMQLHHPMYDQLNILNLGQHFLVIFQQDFTKNLKLRLFLNKGLNIFMIKPG